VFLSMEDYIYIALQTLTILLLAVSEGLPLANQKYAGILHTILQIMDKDRNP
jgi:hypothetical protein